jgi:Hemerythrin HHE cation binding domain
MEVTMSRLAEQAEGAQSETLRAEHEPLLDHAEHIRIAALELPMLSPEERRELIDRIVSFLQGPFAAYGESEARALYPHLERLLHDRHALAGMKYDLEAIARFAEALAVANVHDTPTLQQLLYGVHAVITVHFRKEDELYLPLLRRERPEQLEHHLGAMREVRFEHEQLAHNDL